VLIGSLAPHMIQLDHQLLVQLGLGHLDDRRQQALLRRIRRVLETRVGERLGSSLTKAQLQRFDQLRAEGAGDEAQEFLAATVPNYGTVVTDELNFIATEIFESIRRPDYIEHRSSPDA
jgi:hypothetical protein